MQKLVSTTLLGLCFLILGCAVDDVEPTKSEPAEVGDAPMSPAERESFLRNFPLLDSYGFKRPPTVSGIFPFGVILKFNSTCTQTCRRAYFGTKPRRQRKAARNYARLLSQTSCKRV